MTSKAIPPEDFYQSKQKYPDNAIFCPDGRGWKPAIGIQKPADVSIESSSCNKYFIQNQLIINSFPSGASVIMNDGFIGKTPIVLNNIKPGKHTLTLSSSGYVTAEQEIEIINGIKEEVAVRLSKPDSRESFNRSVISELWKNEFIHQLEKSIDEYKIFWDISFERYIKTTLGINMLRKISTKMLLDKSGKWAYGEVVGEIKCEAIRYMSQNNYFL